MVLPLSEEQISILLQHLQTYRISTSGDRKLLVIQLATDIPKADPPEDDSVVRKQVAKWFRKRLRRDRKPIVKYPGKWDARMVFHRDNKDAIIARTTERCGSVPGSKHFLSSMQTIVKEMMQELEPEDRKVLDDKVKEYNSGKLPRDIQLMHAAKYAGPTCAEFAKHMYTRFGIRVMIMCAMQDKDNDPAIEWHDYNAELEGQTFAQFAGQDWGDKPFLPTWKLYTQEVFGAQEDASPEEVQKGIRKAQSPIILSVDADQLPLLPDETPTNRLDMAAIIRQFVMGYYRYACRNAKATVPWTAMTEQTSTFIAMEYLPSDVILRDPSHITFKDGKAMIDFWQKREARNVEPLDFKVYRARDGEILPAKRSTAVLFSSRDGPRVIVTGPSQQPGGSDAEVDDTETAPNVKGKAGKTAGSTSGGKSRGKGKERAQPKKTGTRGQKRTGRSRGKKGRRGSDAEPEYSGSETSEDLDDIPSTDSEDYYDEDEDFAQLINGIPSEDEVGEQLRTESTPGEPSMELPVIQEGSPAGVHSEDVEEKHKYLKKLSNIRIYKAMEYLLDTNLAELPPFGSWSYPSANLPPALHAEQAEAKKWLAWMRTKPYVDSNNGSIGYKTVEGVALMVGLFLKDIYSTHFAEEESDAGVSPLPPFMHASRLHFSWIDDTLDPICREICDALSRVPKARQSIQPGSTSARNNDQGPRAHLATDMGGGATESASMNAKSTEGGRPAKRRKSESISPRKGRARLDDEGATRPGPAIAPSNNMGHLHDAETDPDGGAMDTRASKKPGSATRGRRGRGRKSESVSPRKGRAPGSGQEMDEKADDPSNTQQRKQPSRTAKGKQWNKNQGFSG